MNYLAYSLSERGVHLDDAETYIRKALVLRPEDGFFLDTLGWIQFKKGQFSRAEETLLEATKKSNTDPEVALHCALTLQKLGKDDEAIRIVTSACRHLTPETDEAVKKQILDLLPEKKCTE